MSKDDKIPTNQHDDTQLTKIDDTKKITDPPTRNDEHPLSIVVRSYLTSLKNIGLTVQIVMPHLSKWLVDEIKTHEKKLEHFLPETSEGESQVINFQTARDFVEFTATLRKLDELQENRALPVLARSLFMQMFCEFDAFTGALIKTIYLRNDNLLKGISREISLSDLLEYENIDAIKCAMLDKEIETFRRDSYVDQFSQLEKKFNIQLRKFNEWSEFVELSQRRNIFTHNNGMVSDQYISICEREGWDFEVQPKLGETLTVDISYFARAMRVLSMVGFMLTHTLWSKVFPQESEQLHLSINDCIYHALEEKRWKTAAELGVFALSDPMKKNVSEIVLRIRVINIAIALKFSEQEDKAKKLLQSYDWSASYRDFKLALCVLEDKIDESIALMESIGRTGEILEQSAYHSWPLFHKLREHPEFYAAYEKIYGEPYLAKVPHDGSEANISVKSERKIFPADYTDIPPTHVKPVNRRRRNAAKIEGEQNSK